MILLFYLKSVNYNELVVTKINEICDTTTLSKSSIKTLKQNLKFVQRQQ